jgi:hypothetical protein
MRAKLRDGLPGKGWRRLLTLLGRAGASVPFFSAFDDSEKIFSYGMVLGEREVGRSDEVRLPE